jgi:hypothetical protein
MGIVINGPIESIVIDDNDYVVITLRWAAKNGLPHLKTFKEKWQNAPEFRVVTFPNLMLPFEFQDGSAGKGKRVHAGFNLLYLENVTGNLKPADVIGLKL